MNKLSGFIDAIGGTPLIKLRKASELTGCNIYGKAEFLNPGGSVKDRAAKFMVTQALKSKLLEPGGLIIEGTAGNTGIGLALCGRSLGLRTHIYMPDTQSEEKKRALKISGAELFEIPAVPFTNPNHYVHAAQRASLAATKQEKYGVFYANQWDNLANREGHTLSTGSEIWDQTNGKIDGFICAIGTGGTVTGVSEYLKSKNKDIRIAVADPMGASMYSWIKNKKLESEGSSIIEGIGQGRVTGNIENGIIDDAYRVTDKVALTCLYELASNEGLVLGGSSGINVAGAIELAKDLGPGKTIVTILCDSGFRYESKLYNKTYLKEKGLPVPDWI
jgi:cysteine synthase A